ncbi:uncharacterized protein [Panulirus ornatus]
MDSDSDDEVFFGRVTEKEEKIAQTIRNRRTEIFKPCKPLFLCQSSVPSLSSQEEKHEQESENDSKAFLFAHGQDLTSSLPSAASNKCGSLSQMSHNIIESELNDQETLFMHTSSHKGVKNHAEYCDGSSDTSLSLIVKEVASKKGSRISCPLQSWNAGISLMSGPDNLDANPDDAHHMKHYSEVSDESLRTLDNENIISEESVNCFSQPIEIQLCDLSDFCAQVDRDGEEPVMFVPTSKFAKEVLLETSVGSEKILLSGALDSEKHKPETTVSSTEISIDTSVSGGVCGEWSVPDTLIRQHSLPKITVAGGSSVPETPFDREKIFTLETTVSGSGNMPETLVSRDNPPETTAVVDNCVLDTAVGGVFSVPEISVIEEESLPRTTVSRGRSMLWNAMSIGCNMSKIGVCGGNCVKETTGCSENCVSETAGGRENCLSETTGVRGICSSDTSVGRDNCLPGTAVSGGDNCLLGTAVSGGDKILKTSVSEDCMPKITGGIGNCMPRTTFGGDNMQETVFRGGDIVSGNTVPEMRFYRKNNVSGSTFSGKNHVPVNTFGGNSKGVFVLKTPVSGGDKMSEASATKVFSVPETRVTKGDCISKTFFSEDSKLEMKAIGDNVTESTVGGGNSLPVMTFMTDCVPEIAFIDGADTQRTIMGEDILLENIVIGRGTEPNNIISGGDTVPNLKINQEDCVTEFKICDLKTFQDSHSREELMCKGEDGENITKSPYSFGLMMNGNLSVEKGPDTDTVGESHAEKGKIFDDKEDLLGNVDSELPFFHEDNQKPWTSVSRILESFNDHLHQGRVSFGQVAEKRVSTSLDSSESVDSLFSSECKEFECQDCDGLYYERTGDWNQKKEYALVDVAYGQTNHIKQDEIGSSEMKCTESNISVNNDVKLVNDTLPLPRSPGLAAAHLDCLKISVTVTPPPSSLIFPSISLTDIKNLQSSVLTTPPLASPYSSFPQNNEDANFDLDNMNGESCGSKDKAVAVSQVEDSMASLPSSSPLNSYSCTFPKDHVSGSSENLNCRSPVYEIFNQPTLDASQKTCDTFIVSVQEMRSSPEKFNDTIEEMEMMLKYGLDYGEKVTETTVPMDKKEKRSSLDEKVENDFDKMYENTTDDFIVSPTRKSSVASIISDFLPALESTQSSSLQEHLSFQRKGSENMEKSDTKTVCYPYKSGNGTEKEPSPKPPQNICSPTVSPRKNISSKIFTSNTHKHLAVSSIVGEQSLVQKNVSLSKQGCSTSRAALPMGRGEKAEVLSPKQPALLKLGGWTPGSHPMASGSCLALAGSLTNVKKSSKIGQVPSGTPVSAHSVVRLQHQSPGSRQKTPALQKFSSALSRTHATESSLPPRPTPNKMVKSVLKKTPSRTTKLHIPNETNNKEKSKVNLASKTQSPTLLRFNRLHLKQGSKVVSPVAKYLKENPPPPLVVNIKPRHKISPKKIHCESSPTKKSNHMLTSLEVGTGRYQVSPKGPKDHEPVEGNIIPVRGEAALSRIQDDLERLALKMEYDQTPVKEEEPGEAMHFSEEDHILPVTTYSSCVPLIMGGEENKENKKSCRSWEIPSNKQHAVVVKHKGRLKIPKVTFKEGQVDSASPKGYRNPSHIGQVVSSSQSCPSSRGSLMEVSLYESHTTQYTNTLHLK